eukprot:m.610445 g.610445  ORF g.610445 m.610445 type:complete len:64 (+) comp58131_c0_seq42:77-268(+)
MIDINRNIRTFAAGLLAVFVLFFILSSGLQHSYVDFFFCIMFALLILSASQFGREVVAKNTLT